MQNRVAGITHTLKRLTSFLQVSQLQARCKTTEHECDYEEVNLQSSDDSGAWMAIYGGYEAQFENRVVKLNKYSSGKLLLV